MCKNKLNKFFFLLTKKQRANPCSGSTTIVLFNEIVFHVESSSNIRTKMHSSRMCTTHLLPLTPGMHCSRRGVEPGLGVPRGVPSSRGEVVYLVPEGGVPGPEGYLGGYLVPGGRWCTWSRGWGGTYPGGRTWFRGGVSGPGGVPGPGGVRGRGGVPVLPLWTDRHV